MSASAISQFLLRPHPPGVPLHAVVRRSIEDAIAAGAISPGEPLPSERELALLCQVSRLTIRKALDDLERGGHVRRVPGLGTFATASRIHLNDLLSFSERMRQQGRVPSSRVLGVQTLTDRETAAQLGLPPDTLLLSLQRLRYADGIPVMIETSSFEAQKYGWLRDADGLGGSLYELLRDRAGVNVASIQEVIDAGLAGEHADLLECEPGSPVFLRRLVAYDEWGSPIEVSHSVARGDICTYTFFVSRGESARAAMAFSVSAEGLPSRGSERDAR